MWKKDHKVGSKSGYKKKAAVKGKRRSRVRKKNAIDSRKES